MIKIVYASNEEFNTDIEATFNIDDEATTTDCIGVFERVLQLAGYGDEAVRSAFEYAEYDLYENIEASHKIMKERREIE